MDSKEIFNILKNKEKHDIYFEDRPVWIQELNNNIAKVSFIDTNEEKDIFVTDLYEKNLYNEI